MAQSYTRSASFYENNGSEINGIGFSITRSHPITDEEWQTALRDAGLGEQNIQELTKEDLGQVKLIAASFASSRKVCE